MLFLPRFPRLFFGAAAHAAADAALARDLRAGIAAHRPARLRALLAGYGARAFARALSGLSSRSIADALSMLPAVDRVQVRRHLSWSAQRRLQALSAGKPTNLRTDFRAGLRTNIAALEVTP